MRVLPLRVLQYRLCFWPRLVQGGLLPAPDMNEYMFGPRGASDPIRRARCQRVVVPNFVKFAVQRVLG